MFIVYLAILYIFCCVPFWTFISNCISFMSLCYFYSLSSSGLAQWHNAITYRFSASFFPLSGWPFGAPLHKPVSAVSVRVEGQWQCARCMLGQLEGGYTAQQALSQWPLEQVHVTRNSLTNAAYRLVDNHTHTLTNTHMHAHTHTLPS